MVDLILTTFDWVPEMPRGYVRDIRVRWALEEARLRYRVESVPFRTRNAEHFSHQPFGQVPWLMDGDISIFESGAILLHLGERSDALMPSEPHGRSVVKEWLFAALNSVEAATLPWSIFVFSGDTAETPGRKQLDQFLKARLKHMEAVLAGREWLAETFSVADILMADVLRLVDRFDGLAKYPDCRDVVRLLEATTGIKTFTETGEGDAITEMRSVVNTAGRIVFLGFAYHWQNLRLLWPKKPQGGLSGRYFLGTAKGISQSDVRIVWYDINEHSGISSPSSSPPPGDLRYDLTCADLFRQYNRTLSLVER